MLGYDNYLHSSRGGKSTPSRELITRAVLQGFIARQTPNSVTKYPWLAPLQTAIESLRSMLSQSTSAAYHASLSEDRSKYQLTSSNPIFADSASNVACGAFVSYYNKDQVFRATQGDFHQLSEETPTFWVFCSACYMGKLEFTKEIFDSSITHLEDNGKSTLLKSFSSCLFIPIQQGNDHLVRFLLDQGIDPNISGPKSAYPIRMAASISNPTILELLLDPKYKLNKNGEGYWCGISHAAYSSDAATGMEMAKMILSQSQNLEISVRQRSSLFFAACRENDVKFAEWLLDNGTVDVYGSALGENGIKPTPLSIAAKRGHLECVRLILRSNFLLASRHDVNLLTHEAFVAAVRGNSLATFAELIPHIDVTPGRIFTYCAAMDGGLDFAEKLLGPIDVTDKTEAGRALSESALKYACENLNAVNVESLMKRGACSPQKIEMYCYRSYIKNVRALEAVEKILATYGSPSLEFDGE